ncbi:MAG TPA: two-component regulator propeller domain-containing protein, partial [Bryobacteraceae bacterium]
MYRLAIILVLAVIRASSAPAGEALQYVSRVWRTQDGLPESRIRAIAQTPDGYLWAGTPGGLARFDGFRFVVYSHFNTPSMTDDNIRGLAVAHDGSLWIATDGGGVLRYRQGQFRAYGPNEGLANEFVIAVLEDRSGEVWAGTNRGLFHLKGERFERIDEALYLPNIAFFGLSDRRGGGILAGGLSGLFVVESGRMRLLNPRPDGEEHIYLIRQSRDGAIWLNTNHGLRMIGYPEQEARRSRTRSVIGDVLEDHAGNMWFGTLGDGLIVVRNGEETVLRAPGTLPNDSIAALLEDQEQNIWAGTSDGLVRLSAPALSMLDRRHGLTDDNISTIYSDRRGDLWLTTVTGKLVRYRDGRAEEVQLPLPSEDLRYLGAFEDHTGAFWFGTDNHGVVRVADGKATLYSTVNGLRNNGFQAFFEDRDANLWIGTTSGLSRWTGSGFRNYYLEDGLSYGWVRCLVADRNGEMLVGTDRGLNRFRDGRFVQDPAFAALRHDRIWSIHADAQGTLWIGTRGAGLARIRNGQVALITTQEGLLSNAIFQVIDDGNGRLWMSSPMGLYSASFADLNAVADGATPALAVLAYGTGDGLESTQLNGGVQQSGCVAANGELWFPTVRGATHFDPRHPRLEMHPPVRIESVIADGQTMAMAGEVAVGPNPRRVEIEFTACTLRAPERVAFRYLLEGVDARWNAATTRRAADYYNLSPGRYRFRVIASDGSTAAGTSEAGFNLVVRPYFYQTGWFYTSAFAACVLAVAAIIRFQERQARVRYNLRLEERTRIAREMHDTVVQGCVGVSTLIEAAVGSARSDQDLMLECLDNARI